MLEMVPWCHDLDWPPATPFASDCPCTWIVYILEQFRGVEYCKTALEREKGIPALFPLGLGSKSPSMYLMYVLAA